jgi:hypothetical protein
MVGFAEDVALEYRTSFSTWWKITFEPKVAKESFSARRTSP